MIALIKKIRNSLSRLYHQRNYYFSKIFPRPAPAMPLHYLPQDFTISVVGDTGIKVIDNFCRQDEADYLINKARTQLAKSKVVTDGKPVYDQGRTSSHSVVFHRSHQDSVVLPIIARGAMLAGVPVSNAEQIYVSRYSEGEIYHGHYDIANDFLTSHRLCTILIYLNTLDDDQGGATYFRDLNVAVKPTMGRAVCWTNMNPDGSHHMETLHAALPPLGENTEKWVIQLWFRPYTMFPLQDKLAALQTRAGKPLTGEEALPDGVWHPTESQQSA
jgi:hypothetical protein